LEAGDEWRMLTSPEYPDQYCELMRCMYRIAAPGEEQELELKLDTFVTEFNYDWLTMYTEEPLANGTTRSLKKCVYCVVQSTRT